MPAKKPIRMKKKPAPARTRTSARKTAKTTPWWERPAAIGAAVGFVMLAAVVLGSFEPSTATPAPRVKASAPATVTNDATVPVASSSAPSPADTAADTSFVEAGPDSQFAGVTLTGCLERSDDEFRLKDTTGASAPKARSWKSGFLRKGGAPVAVVDRSKRLNLTKHVGERVSVTGTLVDREMHVRSLQRVAPSCAASSKA